MSSARRRLPWRGEPCLRAHARAHARRALAALLFACALTLPRLARAGGIEYAGAGARSLARGGASLARTDDPLNVRTNPAALADLQGGHLVGSLNLALFDACFEPFGYYGWGLYQGPSRDTPAQAAAEGRELNQLVLRDPSTGAEVLSSPGRDPEYYRDPLDTVCLEQNVVPVPQLVYGLRVSDRVGFAVGLAYPPAQPSGRWGGPDGVIRGDTGQLRPAATRYMLLQSGNRAFFPTVGFGVQLFPALRLGASFTWGIFVIDTTTMSTSGGGTDPLNHVITRVEAEDYFVPIAAFSAHLVPLDALDVVLSARLHDVIDASGEMRATTGAFRSDFERHTGPPLRVTSVRQGMPWVLGAGVRYAFLLEPRRYTRVRSHDPREPVHDSMLTERFDLELDVELQQGSRNRDQVIRYEPGAIEFVADANPEPAPTPFPPFGVDAIRIPKRWRDQVSVRLGGTHNVLPGLFSWSAGAHYETRGVDPAYAQVDFWPFERFGLHAGVTLRLFGRHDLVLAYAHIFQETLVVAPPVHGDRLSGGFDKTVDPLDSRGQVLEPLQERNPPRAPDGVAARAQVVTQTSAADPAYIINAGTFRSAFDVLSLTLHLHF